MISRSTVSPVLLAALLGLGGLAVLGATVASRPDLMLVQEPAHAAAVAPVDAQASDAGVASPTSEGGAGEGATAEDVGPSILAATSCMGDRLACGALPQVPPRPADLVSADAVIPGVVAELVDSLGAALPRPPARPDNLVPVTTDLADCQVGPVVCSALPHVPARPEGLHGSAGSLSSASAPTPLVEVGDVLSRGEYSIILNAEYYGLPPAAEGWVYMRVGLDAFRVDWASHEVLERVTSDAAANF